MGELVIGHTGPDFAKVWVRGSRRRRRVQVSLTAPGAGAPSASWELDLDGARDYTGVAVLSGLRPDTSYEVRARFAPRFPGSARVSAADVCQGRLHTFPRPGASAPFSFLLGCCNLSTARLTAMRETIAGLLGHSALSRTLERPVDGWYWPRILHPLRRPFRRCAPFLSKWIVVGATAATRFQLPEPELGDPFGTLRSHLAEQGARPAFMIHCGDQIYFDIDAPKREPVIEEYRRAYRQAWFEDEQMRALLAEMPHYMTPDDHDIGDNDASELDGAEARQRYADGIEAYAQYVHARQPRGAGDALWYEFQHGSTFFFVLDTRTERSHTHQRMVGPEQLEAFLRWLREHPTELKFAVTSVPFVAQVRAEHGRCDKWCDGSFGKQRDAILETVYEHGIERLVFLAGDMHATYHATLRIGAPARRYAIHELAGGPINQIEFAQRDKFHMHYRGVTGSGVPFASIVEAFTGSSASVTRVQVGANGAGALRWEGIRLSRAKGEGRYEPRHPTGTVSFA